MNIQIASKPREGSWLWLIKILTGLLVIIVLAVHFVVNHYLAPEGLLSYCQVVAYYKNPIIVVMEALFLIFVVTHSLSGARAIILDLNPSQSAMGYINWGLILLGAVAVLYGVLLLMVVSGAPLVSGCTLF